MRTKQLAYLLGVLFIIAGLFAKPYAIHALETTIETGGTNYVVYQTGTPPFPERSTDSDQGVPLSVLGSYDLHSNVVSEQLTSICASGQKKIGLMFHFFNYLDEWNLDSTAKNRVHNFNFTPAVVNVHGQPSARFQNNVREVVKLIANLKNSQGGSCFNELQFRFAPWATAHPGGWNSWNETWYQENKTFIWSVRDIVKKATANTPLAVYFDLGAEQAGLENTGQNDPYLRRLWSDYVKQFGVSDTYGFSIALSPGRFTSLISVYDSVGVRPSQHAIDIYEEGGQSMISQLASLKTEMEQTGEISTPLLIQETYFNDQVAFNGLLSAINELNLPIRTVMQWQMQRGKMEAWYISPNYRYFGSSGTISCNPTSLSVQPGSTGTAIITSTTSNLGGGWAQVCVSTPSQPNAEMATFNSGHNSTTASWISPGNTYTFTLYNRVSDTKCTGPILASCQVAGLLAASPTPSSSKPGDLNGDNTVNLLDFNLLISKFGNPYTLLDFNAIIGNYGR